ncbi:ATP-binding protein [Planococcus beigongshangi]|uniref:ATP-binding protein n=1 Tax=Planococcus beigongshangi TaxID=2782536 RepID=UPI001EEEBC64|nr:ATP-binding protein [Planococcus beigongshangi]
MAENILFPHGTHLKETLPVYANMAEVSNRIFSRLNEHSAGDWKYIDVTEPFMQLHTHLLDMMKKGQLDFETLAFIYEARPQGKITNMAEDLQGGNLTIETTFENRVIYFTGHDVAIAHLSFYTHSETSWPEFQCYAKSAEDAYRFLQAMDDLLRQMLMNNITFLVDTEDGVRRRNFSTQAIIERSEVMLEEAVKKDIFRSIDEFFKEGGQFFRNYGIPYKRGILLYGSPGNGKTTLVKSITGSTEAPVVYWQITEYTNSATIQEVFSIVSRLAPAILVIEDIDSMPDYTRSVFLNTLDGTQAREGLFVIGTTNYPEKIDPALINRAGRFDRAYEIPSPSRKLRKAYLQKLDIKQIFSEAELSDMASRTKGLSISQLNELYMSSALNWHYDGDSGYMKRIEELQLQNKRTERNDFHEAETYIGF